MKDYRFDWSCIAAVNNLTTLQQNLAASPVFKNSDKLHTIERAASASSAYNHGLSLTSETICVFAHQDVYFPKDWEQQFIEAISNLTSKDPKWAVIGLFGISIEGKEVGRVWSSGLGKELGKSFNDPIPVQSIDELVIILNRKSGLRFDPNLPGFHMYGTDIVQQALEAGFTSYVIHAPVIHNSTPVKTLFGPFMSAYRYMAKKWKKNIPIKTPICCITANSTKLFIDATKIAIRRKLKLKIKRQNINPREIAISLGYEKAD